MSAPPPIPKKLPNDLYPIVRTLAIAKSMQPATYDQIIAALHNLLDKEAQIFLRVPPHMLPVAQGRAQVAQEVLLIIDNVDHYREQLEAQDRAAPTQKP